MPFFLMSSLSLKINARNINYMAVLNFQGCLDLRKNSYNPTGSLESRDREVRYLRRVCNCIRSLEKGGCKNEKTAEKTAINRFIRKSR
jgi:hypothetical protein